MPIDILMPALSPTMEKGNLAKWLKTEGDKVKSGDVIAEIETDKATMEVEAVDEGIVAKILIPAGTTDVPVNQPIAVLALEGEDPKALITASQSPLPTKATPEPVAPPAPIFAPLPAPASTLAQAIPHEEAKGMRIFATPLARRLAKDGHLDIADIAGSGPRGRILADDVRAALTKGLAAPKTAAAQQALRPAAILASGAPVEQIKMLYEPGSYEEVALDGMRKTIAARLLESKQTIPHFYLSLDCELDALLVLREQINAAAPKDENGKPLYKLSVNDFVIKALASALQRVPAANAVWAEDRILRFRHSDVGVAVAIEGGLFTPLIRKAETKTLSAISLEMKDLAARARNRRLKPEEYQGGSTAISNLGMFGVRNFSAVINPPHATILAVGAGEERIVARNGSPAVVQAMTVTLSCDHRVVDGALGAELLAAFRTLIENPFAMLV